VVDATGDVDVRACRHHVADSRWGHPRSDDIRGVDALGRHHFLVRQFDPHAALTCVEPASTSRYLRVSRCDVARAPTGRARVRELRPR
jgi:hypothetical protein